MSQAIGRAYEAIQDGILTGRLLPGERLRERELAQGLGISRTPVREALRQLEADGFVQHRPNAGVVVARLTERSVADLGELRAHLAALCGRLAVRRLDAAGHEEVAALCAATRDCLAAHGDAGFSLPQAFRRVRDTHARLFDLCGNEWLAAAFHRTTFAMVMQASYIDLTPAEWATVTGYFADLPGVLAGDDEALAAAVMEAYFRAAKQRLLRAYRRGVAARRAPQEGRPAAGPGGPPRGR